MTTFRSHNSGFSLVEILIVVGIIGSLSSVVVASVSRARSSGMITKAQSDLREIRTAIDRMAIDTGKYPTYAASKNSETVCVDTSPNNEMYVDDAEAGIGSTDGNYPSWNGPYMRNVPLDPWGNRYIFDADYECVRASTGCENYTEGQTVLAIHSSGPNGSAINVYDEDNIVLVLCS